GVAVFPALRGGTYWYRCRSYPATRGRETVRSTVEGLPQLRGLLGRRVDHRAALGDLDRRKAADFGVFVVDVLVHRDGDGEGLVDRDMAVDPLDVGAELAQHFVRFRRRGAQLLALQRAGAEDIALDDEFAQGHPPPVSHNSRP